MASLPTTRLTEEQYLEIERQAETKSEYHAGEMFAMAGGSPRHSMLASRIGGLLDRMAAKTCRTFNSDLRLYIAAAGVYTYPDCSVICGPLEYSGGHKDVVLNPLLLVEILSPSTEAYDRGKKFELYRTIESLREYLLIHQDRIHVEHYSKQDDGGWLLREYSGEGSVVPIARLSAEIGLAELYAGALDL